MKNIRHKLQNLLVPIRRQLDAELTDNTHNVAIWNLISGELYYATYYTTKSIDMNYLKKTHERC